MSAADGLLAWVYQSPLTVTDYPDQRWYRRGLYISRPVNVFRREGMLGADLSVHHVGDGHRINIDARLNMAQMVELRNALNDALTDLAAEIELCAVKPVTQPATKVQP